MVGSPKNCIDPKTEEEIPNLETSMLRWFTNGSPNLQVNLTRLQQVCQKNLATLKTLIS